MHNIDSFTYTKEPLVQIKKATIHPLDDPGRTKYFSNESFIYHYLRPTDPFVFKEITGKNLADQYKEIIRKREEWEAKQREKYLGIKLPETNKEIKNETIENKTEDKKENLDFISTNNENVKLVNPVNTYNPKTKRNKKLKNSKTNRLGKSVDFCKNKSLKTLNLGSGINSKSNKFKLPKIMKSISHYNRTVMVISNHGSKEMGESYNPYSFFSPPINRTKRNIFGYLFKS